MDFRFPPSGSTYTWTPSSEADLGSGKNRLSGYAGDLSSDGVTLYVYQIADARWKWFLNFSMLSTTDLGTLEAFLANVGGGIFEYRDGACGPETSYVKVQVANEGFIRQWRTSSAGRWAGALVLLEAV